MVETRVALRYRVGKPARIEYGREKVDCVIRDLSTTGSALALQLPICFEVRTLSGGLVSSTPE
jgi:hypothetical protein